ncbi:MoaD/ThiS family protein [Alistipes sp. ZOR0009]|jgi:sulfur carrier protein ThiS|uniref:sulfur carrier protein ThiS n=1 Tax=Alistipes sp. ZOR0009 TaxID=1339253 RepID=UPI000647522B|nr:MoaD/ThiS family protein [Alistipes sp. ZOR0009]
MQLIVNGKEVEIDREIVKIGDLLGLLSIKRIPGMSIKVNGEPIRQTMWIKYPVFDGDVLDIYSSEEIIIK